MSPCYNCWIKPTFHRGQLVTHDTGYSVEHGLILKVGEVEGRPAAYVQYEYVDGSTDELWTDLRELKHV